MTLKKKTKKRTIRKTKKEKELDQIVDYENRDVIKLTKTKLYFSIYGVACLVCGFISYYNSLQSPMFDTMQLRGVLVLIPSIIGGFLYTINTAASIERNFIGILLGTIGMTLIGTIWFSWIVVESLRWFVFPIIDSLLFLH